MVMNFMGSLKMIWLMGSDNILFLIGNQSKESGELISCSEFYLDSLYFMIYDLLKIIDVDFYNFNNQL